MDGPEKKEKWNSLIKRFDGRKSRNESKSSESTRPRVLRDRKILNGRHLTRWPTTLTALGHLKYFDHPLLWTVNLNPLLNNRSDLSWYFGTVSWKSAYELEPKSGQKSEFEVLAGRVVSSYLDSQFLFFKKLKTSIAQINNDLLSVKNYFNVTWSLTWKSHWLKIRLPIMKIKLNFKLFSIDIVDLDSESRFLQPIQLNRLNQKCSEKTWLAVAFTAAPY